RNGCWGGWRIEPWAVGPGGSGGVHKGLSVPLMPFAIRGVIWYQGESNAGIGLKYREKMAALISGWRHVWGKDMPFYFVQIAPWSGYRTPLPPLWEGQVAALKIPGTGMAVTTDLVDDHNDIHPQHKR